jgi:hypothetical protein
MLGVPNTSPTITWRTPDGPIPVAIVVGPDGRDGVKETMYTDNGMEVAISFLVQWPQRLQFLYSLRGSCGYRNGQYWRYVPTSLPGDLGEDQPNADQEGIASYGWSRYTCYSVGECIPKKMVVNNPRDRPGFTPGWTNYEFAVVPTRWRVQTYDVAEAPYSPTEPGRDPSGFPYTTTRWRISGELFSPYTNCYQFENETTPVNEANIGIQRIKTELAITRHFMPFVDTVALDKIFGTVNRDPIQIGGDVNPSHSMLHLGYETQEYVNPSNGRIVYDITHRIMVNGGVLDGDGVIQESWNYFMNRSGKWDRLIQRDGGGTVYRSSQFRCVIWPEYIDCETGGPIGDGGDGGVDDGE